MDKTQNSSQKFAKIMELADVLHELSPTDDIPSGDLLEVVSDILLLLLARSRSDRLEEIHCNPELEFSPFEQDSLGNPLQVRFAKNRKIDLSKYEAWFEDLLFRTHLVLRMEGFGTYPVGEIEGDLVPKTVPEPVYLTGRSPNIVKALRSLTEGDKRMPPSQFLQKLVQSVVDLDYPSPSRYRGLDSAFPPKRKNHAAKPWYYRNHSSARKQKKGSST